MNNIFEKTKVVKPYTYPHLIKYMNAIHESFWTPEHFTFDRDIYDFQVKLSDNERDIIKKCMLAIGLIENQVKTFWGRLDMRMPKTEISLVGSAFANSEVIHQITYTKLLELLKLDDEFSKLKDVSCMEGRGKYLSKYLEGINSRSNKEFTKSLILFCFLVENASLFSQFLIVSSFNKYKNVLSNFNAVIGATAREEEIHSKFGVALIQIIKDENPDWFDDEMENKIRRNIRKAYKAECEIIEWIFEKSELDFLPKESIKEYLKQRFNSGLLSIGYKEEFELDRELLNPTEFLDVQITASLSFDFFNEKGVDYSQKGSFEEGDLW